MTQLFNRFGVGVILSVFALSVGCSSSEHKANDATDMKGEESSHPAMNKPAPDLSIQSLNNKGKISIDGSQGKILIVDFWATWCGPCKDSFPKLESLSKKLGDGVQIVGVSVDDEKQGITEFAKENGATFAIGWDEGHKLAAAWKVDKMPTTFIIDGSGKVRHVHEGYHNGETDRMSNEVSSIVQEGPAVKEDKRVAKNDSKNDSKDDKVDSKSGDKSGSSDKDKPTDKEATAANGSSDAAEEDAPKPKPKPKGKGKSSGKAAGKKKKK